MSDHLPFIDDPAHVALLEGQRYLVLRPYGEVSSGEQWIFPMLVAYCSQLSDDDWSRVPSFIETLGVPSVACVVPYAELAAFDHGREYSGGLYPLSGPQTQQNGAV